MNERSGQPTWQLNTRLTRLRPLNADALSAALKQRSAKCAALCITVSLELFTSPVFWYSGRPYWVARKPEFAV